MTADEIVVRPLASADEIAAFFALAASQFIRDSPVPIAAADFQRYVYEAPDADPTAVRGAFRGDAYLGGYWIEERWLRVGPARLRTGCIGVVVVHPEYRGQGVGKALMRDAFAHARSRGQVLLLLHGLADFYTPFGFADVFDATDHVVRAADVLCSLPSSYRVRRAMPDDATAFRELYDRHFGRYPGSFVRSEAQEWFRLRFAASLEATKYRQRDGTRFELPVVAVDDAGRIRGYLIEPWGPLRAFGSEVAADDWPATLALLQHQARSLDASEMAADGIRWPLPPDSLAAELLADHFIVEQRSTSRPWANWEGCLLDPRTLLREMTPAWTERWLRQTPDWRGRVAVAIDGVMEVLRLGPDGVSLGDGADEAAHAISLTGRVVVPLLFGFRSVAWAAVQEGQRVPPELVPVLETLFPPLTPWIAPTDGC